MQPCWAIYSAVDWFHKERSFVLMYGRCLLCCCQAPESLAPPSRYAGHSLEKAALRCFKSLPFSSRKQPHHSGSSHRAGAPTSEHSGDPLLVSHQFGNISWTRELKPEDAVCRCGLSCAEARRILTHLHGRQSCSPMEQLTPSVWCHLPP